MFLPQIDYCKFPYCQFLFNASGKGIQEVYSSQYLNYLIELQQSVYICFYSKIFEIFSVYFEIGMISKAIRVYVLFIFNNFKVNCQFAFAQDISLLEIMSLYVLMDLSKPYQNLGIAQILDFNLTRSVYAKPMKMILQFRFIRVLWGFTYPREHQEVARSIITVGLIGFDNCVPIQNQMNDSSSRFWIYFHEIVIVDQYLHDLLQKQVLLSDDFI